MRVTGGLFILAIASLALAGVIDRLADNVAQIPAFVGVVCLFVASVTGLMLGPRTARWAATAWLAAVAILFSILLQPMTIGGPPRRLPDRPTTQDIVVIIDATLFLLSFALYTLAIIQAVQESRARRLSEPRSTI
jgi:heme/copper-type cytochrome/quinol oxidase subunit 1